MPSGTLNKVSSLSGFSSLSPKNKQMLYLFLAFAAGFLVSRMMNNKEGMDNGNKN